MFKALIPVDGSENATRATLSFIRTLGWYKEPPVVELLAVHLPVPRVPNMRLIVSDEMIEDYYAEECAAMLAPARAALDAAAVRYTAHWRAGQVAQTIVDQAKQLDCAMIYMGTRGMTALSNMVLGSTATKVLHLADMPVVLIH